MMRSLWSAASGMKAQQTSVDTIAHNISNVNTVAYKSQSTQFKSLLYQTLREETTSANGEQKPTSAQVGLGTRVASINASFTQGAMTANSSMSALCINGNGFFQVMGANGTDRFYTRNGDFTWAVSEEEGQLTLSTNTGLQVLDRDGEVIHVPNNVSADSVTISSDGSVGYTNKDGTYTDTGKKIALFQFPNPTGLQKMANNLYSVTNASGAALPEWEGDNITPSTIAQGYLEGSNVNVADEMVNLIVSQRAYELNSKAITTSDTMLEQANNLKR